MKKITTLILLSLCLALVGGLTAADDEFVKVDKMPEMVKSITPDYPPAAAKDGIEANLIVQAFIDKTGKVIEARAIECSQPNLGFEKAAIDAALKCTYTPASYEGKPVSIWVSYKVAFKLDDKE